MLTPARIGLLLILIVSLVTSATGQNRRRNVEREGVNISGTLKDMGNGLLQIEAADGQMWLVKIAERARELSYVGTAEPGWVRPGMWVQFKGNFNSKLQSDGPIQELTVITPSDDMPWGVIPQVSLGENLFTDEPAAEEPVDRNAFVPCTVAGRIVGMKKNKLSVAAGPAAVTVEVAEDVRVAVDVVDVSLAQVGDQITVRGWKYPMVPGRAMANSVSITSDKPLTVPRPKRRERGEKKKAEEAEQQPAEAAGPDAGAEQ